MKESVVALVETLPNCLGCGKPDAKHACPVCSRVFCTPEGCPEFDEHHPASIVLVLMLPGDSGE